MRVQLALNVNNLEQAITYYSKLFGAMQPRTSYGHRSLRACAGSGTKSLTMHLK